MTLRENLTILRVLWVVWAWEPIKAAWKALGRSVGFQPCCDEQDLYFYDDFPGGFARCRNCGWERPYIPFGI